MSGLKSKGVRQALGAAAVLLALLAFDLVCGQLLLPQVKGVVSAEMHHDLKPNLDIVEDFHGKKYHLRTDSLGFTDYAVREVAQRSDKYRVMMLGASFVEGVGLISRTASRGSSGKGWVRDTSCSTPRWGRTRRSFTT